MPYTAIYISGNLISQELIDKLDDDSAIGQRPADFSLESGTRVRQDIARAWTDANDYWKIFKRKLDALKDTERGTTETRSQWMIPLLGLLGYELNYIQKPESVNDKEYDISHRATNRDALPVMIVSAKDELDKKPEGTTRYRMSPHALLQEYLNVTEHTYGLVTNGKVLRLLRDNGRITRLTYLEFNLEKIFEDDLYADFALLYRLLHVSRMPLSQGQVADSIIEKYYQEAIVAGTRIRSSLSKAVEEAIKILANGLLKHPANDALRQQLQNGQLSNIDFYQTQLRLVYRLLFVMTIEERRLVYPENLTKEQQHLSDIYYRYYSLQHLRNLAGKKHLVQGRHHNLYIQLWHNFQLLEQQRYAGKLGLQALGSGLFEPGKLQPLDSCKMYNKDLLDALYHLSYFTDEESGQTIRVNYGALNVEEFGSVYEGLLEYEAQVAEVNGQWQFVFVHSNERSKSGSHYTPEELVQPLIKHSLEYLILDKLKEKDPVAALLSLKVCDVACGSGHILLSGARRIALEVARKQFDEEQPSPEHLRWATRQVTSRCIYGVDKNPLAVELCKVALWLEAHNPGEPLNFLDHHIRCGDSIVGLAHQEELDKGIADEAFKTLTGDDKDIASAFLKRNKQERKQKEQAELNFDTAVNAEVAAIIEQYNLFKNLPEHTPEEVANKEKQYRQYEQDYHRIRLRQLADAQVAQFFIPKTDGNKPSLLTDAEYRSFLRQVNKHLGVLQSNKLVKAETVAKEKRFFHWFLEFPEVFNEGGFDCILGNPPYLHNQKLSGFFGHDYLNFIQNSLEIDGSCDLVTYFIKRIFKAITEKSFFSIITTNSVSQGRTREQGLEVILKNGGNLNFVWRSIKWSGVADLYVSCFSLYKGNWKINKYLDNKEVLYISSYFDDTTDLINPYTLYANLEMMFQGSIYLGEGFLINDEEKKELISHDVKNSEVIFGLLSGRDVNESFIQKPSSNIINFFDWSEEKAKTYEKPFLRLKELVKPERDKQNRKANRERWWIYAEKRPGLIKALTKTRKCFITIFTSKYLNFSEAPTDLVFTNGINVLASDKYYIFSCLQSNLHQEWARKYGSTLKNDLRYTPTKCFETFPFPQNLSRESEIELDKIGKELLVFREKLMVKTRLGLTKTYNLFHTRYLKVDKIIEESKQDFEICKDVFDNIITLRELHKQIDETVLKAYGWEDINLLHDFHELDYLPEKDRTRYTIHPDARKKVLKRLLELNHQIHEEEVKKGLWDKKGKKKGIRAVDGEESSTEEPDINYGGLFDQQ